MPVEMITGLCLRATCVNKGRLTTSIEAILKKGTSRRSSRSASSVENALEQNVMPRALQ